MATKVLTYFQHGAPSSVQDHVAATLTAREREVLEHIAGGARDREIADTLVVSEATVKKHVQNILRKLHARNRVEAVMRGQRLPP
jgi:DNA-binding NarL/FixJ family response regulator